MRAMVFLLVLVKPWGWSVSERWSGQANTGNSNWRQEVVVKATSRTKTSRTGRKWWASGKGMMTVELVSPSANLCIPRSALLPYPHFLSFLPCLWWTWSWHCDSLVSDQLVVVVFFFTTLQIVRSRIKTILEEAALSSSSIKFWSWVFLLLP